jgi:thiamine biosynthesis protein ThiS
MTIQVNGERVDCGDAGTVGELIARYQLLPETTLLEYNGEPLHQREWRTRSLEENDRLEILRVAAGG